MDKKAFYMNVVTGSVETGAEWMEDQKSEGFPVSDLDNLVEVVKDIKGDWVEA